jgi:hypothetical protein
MMLDLMEGFAKTAARQKVDVGFMANPQISEGSCVVLMAPADLHRMQIEGHLEAIDANTLYWLGQLNNVEIEARFAATPRLFEAIE